MSLKAICFSYNYLLFPESFLRVYYKASSIWLFGMKFIPYFCSIYLANHHSFESLMSSILQATRKQEWLA